MTLTDSSAVPPSLHYLKLSPKLPAITLDEFSLQLEIDLTLRNDKRAFRRRLFTGLKAAYLQGHHPVGKK